MFSELMTDIITIKTKGGKIYTDVAASVQHGKLITERTDIPVCPGDQISRRTQAGVEEIFIVEDPGFQSGLDEIPPIYNMRIHRADATPPPGFTQCTVHADTIINSQIQQGGSQAVMTQSVSCTQKDSDDLRRLVDAFEKHIDDLNLDAAARRRAAAQVATIRAQLEDEPDPVIVKQAASTLRSITEKVVAGLIVAGTTNATVWTQVQAIMSRLF